MKIRRIGRLFGFTILVFGVLYDLSQSQAQDFGSLNGTWDGDLRTVDLQANGPTSPYWRRITILNNKAQVFYRDSKNQLQEVKPGAFRVERHMTNALVYAMNSGHDKDGIWVETWVFAVTQKDRDTLITNFVRVVNNNNLPLTANYSKFSTVATGEFHRKP